jgi:membrane fusion protein, copper/silver efflux system
MKDRDNKIMRLKKPLGYFLLVLTGFLAGWTAFHLQGKHKEPTMTETGTEEIWTCAMHPQIRMPEPGKCPVCGMELIQVGKNNHGNNPDIITFTKESAALANIETVRVSLQKPAGSVTLYGKIKDDERSMQSQVAYFPGRIEKLYINSTGETVRKGQLLAMIYAPDLIVAQQELLIASRERDTRPEIFDAAREKLSQWKIPDARIDEIVRSGKVIRNFDVVATTSGVVTSKEVNEGQYVTKGTVMFGIADLSKLWIVFDAYESDLPFILKGNRMIFSVRALPGRSFSGHISFIDPVIDPVTRVAGVRVEIPNPGGVLKPGMFVTGTTESNLQEYADGLSVPKSAVLWTGKRSIVYIKVPDTAYPGFMLREVELGPSSGRNYMILSGLKEGDEIVTSGTFSIDASAQLAGKQSMMNDTRFSDQENSKSEFIVSGNCDLCRVRIEKAALSIEGVKSAGWNMNTHKLSVEYNRNMTEVPAIQEAVAGVGHDTELFRADNVTYEALPECCHYRK